MKDAAGASVVAYDYDALGRRVRETRPLESKAFYYDGQRVLAELRPYDGLLLRYFVDGPNYIDEHVVMNEGGASTGDFYYLLGSLYSAIGLTNRDGKPVAMYGYDAYGWVSLRTTGAVIGPAGSRLLEITPDAGDDPVALYVSGDPEVYDVSCVAGYVQADGSLGESPVYLTPAEWGTITVSDPGIIPDRTYTVRVAQGSPEEAMLSDAAEAKTWKWGDVANDLGEPVGDGVVGLADILCAMDGFSTPSACTSMDQKPCLQVDGTNDVDDLLVVLDAFGGETYPVSCAAAYPPCYAPAAPPPLPALKHNPYYFTGRRLDHDLKNASGETVLALYHYRARAYDPIHGRFLQRDPAEYVDGANLYEYAQGRPSKLGDATGKWGSEVHSRMTQRWAEELRMKLGASIVVGGHDIGTDDNETGPWPWADQSRHFNTSNGGLDTRLAWRDRELVSARLACTPRRDRPKDAARHLGRALHSVQDWWAHGDYGAGKSQILAAHFSDYDTWGLDATGQQSGVVAHSDGRAPQVIDSAGNEQRWTQWKPGSLRLYGTERDSKAVIGEFLRIVRERGGCRCQEFFIERREWGHSP